MSAVSKFGVVLILALAAAGTCTAEDTAVPGGPKTLKTKVLEAGAEMLQTESPINAIHASVCGIHFYSGEMKRQVIAHHYCSHKNEDVLQCVIYDSNKKDARLIGVEYIVSEAIFKTLPEEEKKLWHSHVYEVKSGALMALRIPNVAEKELMKKLISTYGKTWHFWQVDRGDTLPLGAPTLMMGLTADGQVDQALQDKRDQEFGVSTAKTREARADMPAPAVVPGANAWEKGEVVRVELKSTKSTESTTATTGSPAR